MIYLKIYVMPLSISFIYATAGSFASPTTPGGNNMTLANTQATSFWQRRLDSIGVVGLLAITTVLPPLIFVALLIIQHQAA